MKLIVGITGASGSIYANYLIIKALNCDKIEELVVIPSEHSFAVWQQEMGEGLNVFLQNFDNKLKVFDNKDFFTPPASGSSDFDVMVIVPCSMATLGKIANGISNTLMTRAADVMLKEKKKLVLSVREAPYNLIHIDNMRKITLSGGIIYPLSPVFYNNPKSIRTLIQNTVERILNLSVGCENEYKWEIV